MITAQAELPIQWEHAEITARRIPIDLIDVPSEYESDEPDAVKDDAVRRSIQKFGVQQSVIVFPNKKRFTLVKGGRRVRLSEELRLKDVPAIVHVPPAGVEDLVRYRNRIRFILTQARQDLKPSQRAELIISLMAMFGMKQKDVAAYLGVDAGSITNWLAIKNYIPPVVKALDAGEITQFAARSFDGMSPSGQRQVWKAHRDDLGTIPAGKMHKLIRTEYHPEKHPEFYIAPEKTAEKLTRTRKKRASKTRPKLTRSEKDLLLNDLGLRETELKDSQAELAQLKKEITLATAPIRAILRSADLVAMLPEEVKAEFERFGEVYI